MLTQRISDLKKGRACAKSVMPSQHSLCQKPHHRGKLIRGNGYIPSANTSRQNAIRESAKEAWSTNQWTFLQLFVVMMMLIHIIGYI